MDEVLCVRGPFSGSVLYAWFVSFGSFRDRYLLKLRVTATSIYRISDYQKNKKMCRCDIRPSVFVTILPLDSVLGSAISLPYYEYTLKIPLQRSYP